MRDELIKALEAQPENADVQLSIGDLLVDVVCVDYASDRQSIVLEMHPEDLEEVMCQVASRPWWRGRDTPGT